MAQFPSACHLSDGGFKTVFKVCNPTSNAYEALSVMLYVKNTSNKPAVTAELAVSSMLPFLARTVKLLSKLYHYSERFHLSI
mmetsp:Transcript_26614/g.48153  ORF Transcript_26614/g.48153 Transcript_26614/m.48153 type:complete len:82 (+) Transcript_26614:371-616(+)